MDQQSKDHILKVKRHKTNLYAFPCISFINFALFVTNSNSDYKSIMSEDLAAQVATLAEQNEQLLSKTKILEAECERLRQDKQAKEMIDQLEKQVEIKEEEIKALKQQEIKRTKIVKTHKAEIAQLQTENASLKEQLASSQRSPEEIAASKALEEEITTLRQTVIKLTQQLVKEKQQKQQLEQKWKVKHAEWQKKQKDLMQQVQKITNVVEQLQKYNQILEGKLIALEKFFEKEREMYEGRLKVMIRQQTQTVLKHDMKIKQHKETIRIQNDQIESLQSKLKVLPLMNQPQLSSPNNLNKSINILNQTQFSHPSPFTLKSSIIEDEDFGWSRINYSCLLVTKPHYMSPFLEVYEDKKLLKIYKSTRSGCFQRSMGYYKHKFDNLAFEQEQIIDPISQAIMDSQEITHHSIILYGVKKSNKKYMMSKILVKLKNFLISKLSNCEEVSSIYIKRSQEEQKNCTDKGSTKQEIIDIINKVIALGYKNQKAKDAKFNASPRKGQSKPKVRFFNFTADNFYFQIGTSSFTNLSFRQKMTPVNMLNNILYSKLPDILQSAITQKYLILTVNPIVDLYQDCKNTLSTTFCRASQVREEDEKEEKSSPVREELNEIVRKKLDALQRDNQQVLIRSRKFQEECNYYRSRFDQLQCRLKNLLNTHSGQTSYLKKSPVTLSYEKLLKFIHSVQSRTQMATFLQLNQSILGKTSTIYIQKQSHSVDAL